MANGTSVDQLILGNTTTTRVHATVARNTLNVASSDTASVAAAARQSVRGLLAIRRRR